MFTVAGRTGCCLFCDVFCWHKNIWPMKVSFRYMWPVTSSKSCLSACIIIIKATKESFENNMHHQYTMKTIAKAYLSNQEFSVKETIYHILPELKLRRIFQLCIFLTQIFQRREFKYYFQKKNLVNYQTTAQIY